jgi:hypothetical protein
VTYFQTVTDAHTAIAKLPRAWEHIGLIITSDESFKDEHSEPNEIDRIRGTMPRALLEPRRS